MRPIDQPFQTLSLIPASQECTVCRDTPACSATCCTLSPSAITANTT
jgi:hypothetical protein